MKKLVTVAIPTYNREGYIKESINSVLNQTHKNLELLVVDNHSEDNTQKVIDGIHDRRIRYVRNKKNIGILSNWNKCISLAKSKYLVILGDDDILLPTFVEESLRVHGRYNLGFSFTHCNKVDENGKFLMRWGYNFPPPGFLRGDKYLELIIKSGACLTNSTTVMLNKDIFKEVGKFEAKYSSNTFDFNMWIKIADKFNLYFIDKVLAHYRIHKDQVSEIHWRRKMIHTGKIGTYLEIFDAIARLLQRKSYYANKIKRRFILDKLKEYDLELTKLLTETIPEL
mgnify:CR=1 FL=1